MGEPIRIFVAVSEGRVFGLYRNIPAVVAHLGEDRRTMARLAMLNPGEVQEEDPFGLSLTYMTVEEAG